MNPILIVAGFGILSWGILVVLVGVGVVHFDDGVLATAGGILVALVGKAFGAIKSKRQDNKGADVHTTGPRGDGGAGGFARLGMLAMVVVLSACGTIAISSGHVQIDPVAGGAGAVIVVSDSGGERARVEVAKLSAPISIPGSLLCATMRGVLDSYNGGDKLASDAWLESNTKCVRR